MSIEVASSIFYTYAKERRGEAYLMEALISRVEQEADHAELLSGPLLAQIIVSLNMCGRTDSNAFQTFKSKVEKAAPQMSEQERMFMQEATC
jgi:hypothetical protein